MAVLKEYRCLAHSTFESSEESPRCPVAGCETVIRCFLTAPGTRSAKTKGTDATLERLARQFGLTDMSNRNGSVTQSERKNGKADPRLTPHWGTLPKEGQGSTDAATYLKSLGATSVAPAGDGLSALQLPDGAKFRKPRTNVKAKWGDAADLQKAIASS